MEWASLEFHPVGTEDKHQQLVWVQINLTVGSLTVAQVIVEMVMHNKFISVTADIWYE